MSATRPRILDPHAVPVIGTDAHLAAVDPLRLTPLALRERFGTVGEWQPEIVGDTDLAGRHLHQASVLVPLVQRPEGLQVLLTQRLDRGHAGHALHPQGRADHGHRRRLDR